MFDKEIFADKDGIHLRKFKSMIGCGAHQQFSLGIFFAYLSRCMAENSFDKIFNYMNDTGFLEAGTYNITDENLVRIILNGDVENLANDFMDEQEQPNYQYDDNTKHPSQKEPSDSYISEGRQSERDDLEPDKNSDINRIEILDN